MQVIDLSGVTSVSPLEQINDEIAALVNQKVNEAIATLTMPFPIGAYVACSSKTLGTDEIASAIGWEWLRGDLWSGGTIGGAASNATLADNRLINLYRHWGGTEEGWVNGVAIDYPDIRGRKITCAGHGSGLSDRAIGDRRGEEKHRQTLNELVSHTHLHKEGDRPLSMSPIHPFYTGAKAGSEGWQATTPSGGSEPFNVLDPDIALPILIFLGVRV